MRLAGARCPESRDTLPALGAALLATTLEAVGRFAWDSPYLPELTAEAFFGFIPPWAFTPLFRTFGYNSKYYAFAAMIAAEIGGLALGGAVLRRWLRDRQLAGRRTAWCAAAVAAALAGVILIGILPLVGAGLGGWGTTGGARTAIPTVIVVAACYAAVLAGGVSR